jgi:hypothetical protein
MLVYGFSDGFSPRFHCRLEDGAVNWTYATRLWPFCPLRSRFSFSLGSLFIFLVCIDFGWWQVAEYECSIEKRGVLSVTSFEQILRCLIDGLKVSFTLAKDEPSQHSGNGEAQNESDQGNVKGHSVYQPSHLRSRANHPGGGRVSKSRGAVGGG